MNSTILSLVNIQKRFGSAIAVADVSFDLAKGEKLGIIGPNGSGKTTLINCLTGVLRPEAGTIIFEGKDITSIPAHKRARLGIVRSFQIPRPFVGISVLENVLVPLDYIRHQPRKREQAFEFLEMVGLTARANHLAETLSQLELRMLELARALACNPQLLIVDEVMAGLTESEIDEVMEILVKLNDQGVTVVMIEHIMHAIMRFSKRLICIETGRIIADGTPTQVAENPEVRRVYFGQ